MRGKFSRASYTAINIYLFLQEEKKIETYQVEIYQHQVCLSYCNIAGTQQNMPVPHRTAQDNLSMAIINQRKDPSTVSPTLFIRKCLGKNKN